MPTEHGKKFVSVFDPQTIESFLSIRQTAGAKLATLQRYRNVLQSVVTFFGDELPESSQSTERWRDYLLQEGYALNTVNGMTSALNVYLAYIGRTDLCLRRKRVPKVPTNQSQPTQNLFDDGEIETFLNNRLAEGTGVMMMKRYRKTLYSAQDFVGNLQPITELALQQWQDHLLNIGYAVSTVNSMTSALNTYLTYIGYSGKHAPHLLERKKGAQE